MELDDILEGKPEPVEEPVVETPTVEDTPVEAAAEPVEETPQEEPEPTDIKDEGSMSEPEKTIPIASYMAEKEKRQEREDKIAQLEKQLEENKPDFFEDPEAALNAQTKTFETEMTNLKVNMSVDLAKTVYSDYDEIVGDNWEELVQQSPLLLQQAYQSENPGRFAYDYCKNQKTLQEIGDPAKFKERMKAEILKELEGEVKAKETRENLPESLANVPSVTAKPPAWTGPESLDEIVG